MGVVGLIVEKPSAARNFAKALGGMSGTFNGEKFVIATARGHLYEFDAPENQVPASLQAEYKSWDLAKLPWNERDFQWKLKKSKDVASTLSAIKAALAGCEEVCAAGDLDPSGEGFLIDYEIIKELGLRPKKFSRMYFVDESVAELQKGFKQRKVIPDLEQHDEVLKAKMRQRWDFLSMQFTRIATKCGDGRAVLRQGRLKSAMVKIVGDQLALVNNYKKIPFYENRFRDENGVVYTNPDEPRFPDKGQVQVIQGQSGVVCDGKVKKATAPPKLMDLAGLAALLAPKGLSAKKVQELVQAMYNESILSYPRTEDKYISEEQFKEMLPLVDKIAAVVGVDTKLLTHREPRKTHVKNGGSHGANRPGKVVPTSLDSLDATFGKGAALIYKTLALNFLTMFGEDYEYESQKGHVADYPKFVGTANVPVKMGWRALTAGTDLADDDEDASKGLGTVAAPFIHEGFPPKPTAPTMKWLMSQLEKWEVGTGATRTSTYAEVTSSTAKYPLLVDTKGKITMSEYGEMSYQLLPGTHIGSLELTAKVWQQMKDVAAGKADINACLHEVQQLVIDDISTMQANGERMRAKLGISMKSGSGFADKEKYTGVWNGNQVSFNRIWGGYTFSDEECARLCAGETIEIMGLKSKTGSTYGVRGKLSEQTFKGKRFVGFDKLDFISDNSGSGSVPASWCNHKFTKTELKKLEAGETIAIKNCTSKRTGKKFDCNIKFEGGKLVPLFN